MHTLRFKVLITVFFFTLISLILSLIALSVHWKKQLDNDFRTDSDRVVKRLSTALAIPYAHKSEKIIKDLLKLELANPDLISVIVSDEFSTPSHIFYRDQWGKITQLSDAGEIPDDMPYMTITDELISDGRKNGQITVVFTKNAVDSKLRQFIFMLLSSSILILFAALTGAARAVRYSAEKGLYEIARLTGEYAELSFSRTLPGSDIYEFSHICENLNSLRERILAKQPLD